MVASSLLDSIPVIDHPGVFYQWEDGLLTNRPSRDSKGLLSKLFGNPFRKGENLGVSGQYRTRKPREILEAVQRSRDLDSTSEPGERTADSVLAEIPKIFDSNLEMLIEGTGIREHTLAERFERSQNLFDRSQIKWLIGSVASIIGLGYVLQEGQNPNNVTNFLYNLTNLPEGSTLEGMLNAANESLFFFFKGESHDNAILGMASSIAKLTGLIKGVIPWRADQIKYENSVYTEEKKRRSLGTFPYQHAGHLVGIGLKDPLMASEVGGKSLLRRLRQKYGEVVPILRSGTFPKPSNINIELNDEKFFVNIENLLTPGTVRAETMLPSIVSGLYKAAAYIANFQRDFELFEKQTVDSTERERIDYAMAVRSLKFATKLRELMLPHAPRIRSSFIIPQYLETKLTEDRGADAWKYTAHNFFMTGEELTIDGIVIPELVFTEMVYEELKKGNKLDAKIFINTYGKGESQPEEKAGRFKEELGRVYAKHGVEFDAGNVITGADQGRDATVEIFLRKYNTNMDYITGDSRTHMNRDLVLYSTTTRGDKNVLHLGGGKRVPINYKARIAELVTQHLDGNTGIDSSWERVRADLKNLTPKTT